MGRQRKRELPPEVAAALSELKAALANIYSERLRGVYPPPGDAALGSGHLSPTPPPQGWLQCRR